MDNRQGGCAVFPGSFPLCVNFHAFLSAAEPGSRRGKPSYSGISVLESPLCGNISLPLITVNNLRQGCMEFVHVECESSKHFLGPWALG